jgi:hypothetical protein
MHVETDLSVGLSKKIASTDEVLAAGGRDPSIRAFYQKIDQFAFISPKYSCLSLKYSCGTPKYCGIFVPHEYFSDKHKTNCVRT